MASRPRKKMPIAERAKQFMPFAAVQGLREALEKKRKRYCFEKIIIGGNGDGA